MSRVLAYLCSLSSLPLWALGQQDMYQLVREDTMMGTLAALQRLGERSTTVVSPNGTRERSSASHNLTMDYIVESIRNLSGDLLSPRKQTYDELTWWQTGPSTLEVTSPTQFNLVEGVDYAIWRFSPGGLVEGKVTAIPNYGCDAADFQNFTAGDIALIPQGPREGGSCWCEKVQHALAAKAQAMFFHYYEGQGAASGNFRNGWCGGTTVPVIGIILESGNQLLSSDAHVMIRYNANLEMLWRGVSNVILDLPGANEESVVVIGAHADSVAAGPGINDDGSGIALVMEMLRVFGERYGFTPNAAVQNSFRLCWWASEEWGLLGSKYYVESLSEEEHKKITGYLNFDMMASINGVNWVEDAAQDQYNYNASRYIEVKFANAFTALGENWSYGEGSGASDYGSFWSNAIPAGAIFAGAGEAKSPEEALKFGGTAGMDFDPCYHKACDIYPDNIDPDRQVLFAKVGAQVLQDFLEDPDLPSHLARTPQPTPAPAPTPAPTPAPNPFHLLVQLAPIALGVLLVIGVICYINPTSRRLEEPLVEVEVQPSVP